MQAMAEGGHDPAFDVTVELDEDAMAAFASLTDLERHLPLTPPRGNPWSFPIDQQTKKPHRHGVRAGKKVQVDRKWKAMERAERVEQ